MLNPRFSPFAAVGRLRRPIAQRGPSAASIAASIAVSIAVSIAASIAAWVRGARASDSRGGL
jgi:hypothetical protein